MLDSSKPQSPNSSLNRRVSRPSLRTAERFHDALNQVTVVQGWLDVLRHRLASQPELLRLTEEMHKAATHASRILRDGMGGVHMTGEELVTTDLSQAVPALEEVLRALLGEELGLELEIPTQAMPVHIAQDELESVLLSLVANSRDALSAGGRVRIELRQDGAQALLTVDDNGCGMSPDVVSHCFEPWFTTKDAEHGSGLGLPAVRDVIEQHGGRVSVVSRPRVGTRIELLIPLIVSKPNSEHAFGRILLVDDEESVRNLVQDVLQMEGFRVVAAAGPTEALHLVENDGGRFSLLLSDLTMPGMDGRELAARLRLGQPNLPVLFISGYAQETPLPSDANTTYLTKPFRIDDLVNTVRSLVLVH